MARSLLQRLSFIYLATYLLVGGLGFLLVPEMILRLLLSSGSYGDVMPRLVGVTAHLHRRGNDRSLLQGPRSAIPRA
jgi:hypothetical protein